jgi:hypothetical protein
MRESPAVQSYVSDDLSEATPVSKDGRETGYFHPLAEGDVEFDVFPKKA